MAAASEFDKSLGIFRALGLFYDDGSASLRRCHSRARELGLAKAAPLQRLEVGDQVVLLAIGQHVLVTRHAAAAFVDAGENGGVADFLAVLQFVSLEQTLEAGPHLGFRA